MRELTEREKKAYRNVSQLDKSLRDAVARYRIGDAMELLHKGGNPNLPIEWGRYPLLHFAINAVPEEEEALELAKCLIRHGARLDIVDGDGMTALDWAVKKKRHAIGEYLERSGAASSSVIGRHTNYDVVQSCRPLPGVSKDKTIYALEEPVEEEKPPYLYKLLGEHAMLAEPRNGGITMIFNFWTEQVMYGLAGQAQAVAVQNFDDIQRQEAVAEAERRFIELGGKRPENRGPSIPLDKKARKVLLPPGG